MYQALVTICLAEEPSDTGAHVDVDSRSLEAPTKSGSKVRMRLAARASAVLMTATHHSGHELHHHLHHAHHLTLRTSRTSGAAVTTTGCDALIAKIEIDVISAVVH